MFFLDSKEVSHLNTNWPTGVGIAKGSGLLFILCHEENENENLKGLIQ